MLVHGDTRRARRIFEKILRVAPELEHTRDCAKSQVNGLMDLHLDVVQRGPGFVRIALSHYYKHPSEDTIADPDMELLVHFHDGLAEALTYQDAFIYEMAYPEEGGPPDKRVHARLNVFLEQWLDNLIAQGHLLPRG